MQRNEIILQLKKSHHSFVTYVGELTNDEFLFSYQQKWTAGQQLEHIYLAVRPVALAFKLPKLLVRALFGKANRPSRTYDELVKKYQNTLATGGKASRPFVPNAVTTNQKEKIIGALNRKINSLCSALEAFTEQELDTLVLPHPLLGKVTMREMLYFTICHVGHHHELVSRYLKSSNKIGRIT